MLCLGCVYVDSVVLSRSRESRVEVVSSFVANGSNNAGLPQI